MAPRSTSQRLPSPYSPEVLARNLAVLARIDPPLAERLHWPVDHSRVRFAENGAAFHRLHRTLLPLDLDPALVEELLAAAAGAAKVAVLGLGVGELLDAVLARPSVTRVVAWDRDPWYLRLALSRRDYTPELAEGRLSFALASDLLEMDLTGHAPLRHPCLGALYGRELRYLGRRPSARRVALCAGGLFVDQLAHALAARGFDPWTIEIEATSREELDLTMERFRPRLVAAINYTEGLVEFCRDHGAKLLCWEVDASLSRPRPQAESTADMFVFTHRRANVEEYRNAGFTHVEYTPLAADPAVRVAGDVPQGERPHPVSFVGASMVDTARDLRRRFVESWDRWREGRPDAGAEGRAVLDEILRAQRARPTEFILAPLLEERAPGFAAALRDAPAGVDPVLLAAEVAASEKRLGYVATLGALGMRVWGDAGWKIVERHGVRYMGPAAHGAELTGIYNDTRVNVDVGRLYQNDIVTMRVFDALSCGSFLLAEHNAALEEAFEVGVEVESYRTVEELLAKTRRFLEDPAAAREIARRGRAAVHERHTIAGRLDHMLAVMGEAGVRSAQA